MSEFSQPMPGELGQIKNFLIGGKEILKMEGSKNVKQAFLLAGIQTIVPQEINDSGFLLNPARQTVLQKQLNHQVRLNDFIDFEGVGNENINDLTQAAKEKEVAEREALEHAINALPDGEREAVRTNIENCVKEVTYVESWIRQKQDAHDISFQDVDVYRSLANIINIVASTATIFGPESLKCRTQTIQEEEFNIQAIIDKYAWAFGSEPDNNIERAIMIMFHTVMDGQLSDDWHDKYIDRAMRVPSYGRVVSRMFSGNKKLAQKHINKLREEHREKSRELGLGKIATYGVSGVIGAAEGLKVRAVNGARKFGKTPHFTLREKAYAQGRFD